MVRTVHVFKGTRNSVAPVFRPLHDPAVQQFDSQSCQAPAAVSVSIAPGPGPTLEVPGSSPPLGGGPFPQPLPGSVPVIPESLDLTHESGGLRLEGLGSFCLPLLRVWGFTSSRYRVLPGACASCATSLSRASHGSCLCPWAEDAPCLYRTKDRVPRCARRLLLPTLGRQSRKPLKSRGSPLPTSLPAWAFYLQASIKPQKIFFHCLETT